MTPTLDQVLSLPAAFDQTVAPEFIDVNGHMNIGDYFRLGSRAAWTRLEEVATGADYIARRDSSFFTVEHAIRYLGELREGQRLSVHSGFVARTDKALHAVSYVVDREHDRVACAMEIMLVHVSMTDRRATSIPADVAVALDADIASYGAGWLPAAASRLTLRQTNTPGDGKITP